MQIVKLDATDSTNAYLKRMLSSNTLDDFTVVVAKSQTSGRGQRNAKWISEPGKNLTVSVLKKINALPLPQQFYLSMLVSLAVLDTLKKLQVPDLHIKWPNDILSGNSKICGILIENVLSGRHIRASVIGVGLNVNQTSFVNLPNATSLKLLLGRSLDLDEVLHVFLENLRPLFLQLDGVQRPALRKRYLQHLFKKDQPATFQIEGGRVMGFIRDISPDGKLILEMEGALRREFGLKEIKLLY